MDASNKCFDHNGMPMVEKSENAFSNKLVGCM